MMNCINKRSMFKSGANEFELQWYEGVFVSAFCQNVRHSRFYTIRGFSWNINNIYIIVTNLQKSVTQIQFDYY